MPSDPTIVPDLVQNYATFDDLQFTFDEVQSVMMLELDVNKGVGPDSIPALFFYRSLSTPIFKKTNNVEDYREMAIV
jgi:hypothetical protein